MARLLNMRTAPALIGVIVLLIFVLQNEERVTVQFLWLEETLPKAALILLAAALGLLVGLSGGLLLRRRRS